MRTGIFLGYAGGFKEAAEQVVALEQVGIDIALVAEAYSYDAISQLGYLAAKTSTIELGTGVVPIYTRTPVPAGDDGGRGGRLRLRGTLSPRHRHVRAAGRRGLPRRAVRCTAGAHPRGGRDLQAGVAAREGQLRRQVLPTSVTRRPRHGTGQAPEADQSPCTGTYSDHHRGTRTAERGAHRRDRRRLAARLLLPGEGRRGLGGRGAARRRRQTRSGTGPARRDGQRQPGHRR